MITLGMPSRTRFVIWTAVLPVMGFIFIHIGLWYDGGFLLKGMAIYLVGTVIQIGYLIFLRRESQRFEKQFVALIKRVDAKRDAFIELMRKKDD